MTASYDFIDVLNGKGGAYPIAYCEENGRAHLASGGMTGEPQGDERQQRVVRG